MYEPGLDKIVTIPLYECVDNNIPQVHPGPACPNPPVTSVGTNTGYRVVALAAMILDKAYIQANNPSATRRQVARSSAATVRPDASRAG